MKSSEAKQAELLAQTKERASALIEDLEHIRELLAQGSHPRAELRQLSVTLRRLLLGSDRDVPTVAAPRIGRIKLLVPDNNPILKSFHKKPVLFLVSGGAKAFGVYIRALWVTEGKGPPPMDGFDPERTANVNVDGFLSQPVLCLQNKWATRRNVIEYVANLMSAAHSGSPETAAQNKRADFDLLARIRNCVTISLEGGPRVELNFDALWAHEPEFRYTPDALDPVLFELMSAAHFLTASPDTTRLEQNIRKELGLNS